MNIEKLYMLHSVIFDRLNGVGDAAKGVCIGGAKEMSDNKIVIKDGGHQEPNMASGKDNDERSSGTINGKKKDEEPEAITSAIIADRQLHFNGMPAWGHTGLGKPLADYKLNKRGKT